MDPRVTVLHATPGSRGLLLVIASRRRHAYYIKCPWLVRSNVSVGWGVGGRSELHAFALHLTSGSARLLTEVLVLRNGHRGDIGAEDTWNSKSLTVSIDTWKGSLDLSD